MQLLIFLIHTLVDAPYYVDYTHLAAGKLILNYCRLLTIMSSNYKLFVQPFACVWQYTCHPNGANHFGNNPFSDQPPCIISHFGRMTSNSTINYTCSHSHVYDSLSLHSPQSRRSHSNDNDDSVRLL